MLGIAVRSRQAAVAPFLGWLFFCLLPTACPLLCFGQEEAPNTAMRAMTDELNRSMAELRLKDLEKPYFIQYVVLDKDEWTAEATFGALTSSVRSRRRLLHAQVRVGDYTFDNSEFVTGPGGSSNGILVPLVLDDDYSVLRHAIWLATDTAYKQAVEVFARKRGVVQNKTQVDSTPDFSRESPTRVRESEKDLHFSQAELEQHLCDWSRLFRKAPEIQSSEVRMTVRQINRYLVNSEQTAVSQLSTMVLLEIEASAQAADGMTVDHRVPFYARTLEQLPGASEVDSSIEQLIAELRSVRSAPVLETGYSGPVLLTGSAATDLFARVFAPNVSGQRPPLSERPQQSYRGSEFLDRMNRPVLPTYFSVFDDPGLKEFASKGLIGYYAVDDQGVPGRRVSLVEDGLLVDFLMSRRPGVGRLQSNGHGRSGYPGRESANISNLVVNAREGKSYEDLKEQLIALCRAERLPYGLVIKSLEPGGAGTLGIPFWVYKVFVDDGREELTRGVTTSGIVAGSLRHIQAAGNEAFVANRLIGIRGAETPVSVIAPSILLEEVELKRPAEAQQKPALLTPPGVPIQKR